MMTWGYRVTKQVVGDEELFEIREVYYDEGRGFGWTEDPIAADGESVDEVRSVLERMLAACDQPVLDLDNPDKTPPPRTRIFGHHGVLHRRAVRRRRDRFNREGWPDRNWPKKPR